MKKGIMKLEHILVSQLLIALVAYAQSFVQTAAAQAGRDDARRWLS